MVEPSKEDDETAPPSQVYNEQCKLLLDGRRGGLCGGGPPVGFPELSLLSRGLGACGRLDEEGCDSFSGLASAREGAIGLRLL